MNGATSDGELWQAVMMVPPHAVPAFQDALDTDAVATSSFETTPGGPWTIEVLLQEPVDRPVFEARVAEAAARVDMPAPSYELTPVPDRDWVTASYRAQPPVRAGRFFVHGAHDRGNAPGGAMTLEVDAGRAFGNGHHETTYGCLLALDHLAKTRDFQRPIQRPLDLGCGAGVLAMAMARLWRVRTIASDIDPWAVAVARANARINNLHPWLRPILADGFAHPGLSSGAPYDLIVANILARPLQRLAPAIAAHLAPGGRVILSGLLTKQDAQVRAAYVAQGLHLVRSRQFGDWLTLELAA